jgi:hypothetical protein
MTSVKAWRSHRMGATVTALIVRPKVSAANFPHPLTAAIGDWRIATGQRLAKALDALSLWFVASQPTHKGQLTCYRPPKAFIGG